ncbi:hypothetical protein BLOT_007572 [Blomia tropicalis]|nr:hypothetical protein BLOT_007572 [Blomia tropicalis]
MIKNNDNLFHFCYFSFIFRCHMSLRADGHFIKSCGLTHIDYNSWDANLLKTGCKELVAIFVPFPKSHFDIDFNSTIMKFPIFVTMIQIKLLSIYVTGELVYHMGQNVKRCKGSSVGTRLSNNKNGK